MACSSSLAPPCQLRSLAGQEHGRTIPLTDLSPGGVRPRAAVKAARPAARPIAWLPRESTASGPHEAFELAFRPGQRLLHGFALVEAHAHLGQGALGVDLLSDLRRRRRCRDRKRLVVVWIRVMEERALWRSFFGPCLQGGELLKCRQVIAAARRHQFLDRSRLRQMHKQALCRLLVLGEIPDTPEKRKEGCKAALRTYREAASPALLRDLWRIAFGNGPCARRVHDQCALARDQPFVVGTIVPGRRVWRQECHQLLVVLENLPH